MKRNKLSTFATLFIAISGLSSCTVINVCNHNYVYKYDDDQHWIECSKCGAKSKKTK